MLRIFQRSLSLRPLLPGGVDAHCHLLPGVDDGADTVEESLAIIRGQQALGLRGAICTPHIMARLPQNTPQYLRKVFADFTAAAGRELEHSKSKIQDSKFQLHLAAEYMLDEAFPRHLASGDLLTIDSSLICPTTSGESSNRPCLGVESGAEPRLEAGKIQNPDTAVKSDPICPTTSGKSTNRQSSIVNCQSPRFLLVELPQYLLPPGWQDMLDGILAAGITPLLAHPERYLRILDERDIRALVDRGIALQGNLGSLTGYYGRRVKTLAQSLLADKLYTTFGTDSHSAHMLKHLNLAA